MQIKNEQFLFGLRKNVVAARERVSIYIICSEINQKCGACRKTWKLHGLNLRIISESKNYTFGMKTLKKSHAVTVNRLQNNYIIPLRQKKVFIFIEKNKNNIEKKHDDEKKCKQKKH